MDDFISADDDKINDKINDKIKIFVIIYVLIIGSCPYVVRIKGLHARYFGITKKRGLEDVLLQQKQ